MDTMWRQEAEREMTRRFTTPLLPLKLVEGSSILGHIEPQPQRTQTTAAYASSQARKAKTLTVPATNTQHTTQAKDLQQKRVPPPPPDASATNKTRLDLPATPAHRSSLTGFIQDLNQDLIRHRPTKRTNMAESPSGSIDKNRSDMQRKIAQSAASLEETLPIQLGYRRKDVGVRFRE